MLILLPPSQRKAAGGTGGPLDLQALLWPSLQPTRELMIEGIERLAADPLAARRVLKVTVAKDDEIAGNAVVRAAPTLPAIDRYTGVLYDALEAGSMSRIQRARAMDHIVIASALFGALRAGDAIPAYRLAADCTLPGAGRPAALWRPGITAELAAMAQPVLDLRSGAYAAFGAAPHGITVRVVTTRPDGTKAVVSHFNKAIKGRLARLVATARTEPTSIDAVIRLAVRGGLSAERSGADSIEIHT